MACCEDSLPRVQKNRQTRMDGSEGTPQLNPNWKLQFAGLQREHGVEIESLQTMTILIYGSEFSHGWHRLVSNLNNNERVTSEMQFEEYAFWNECRWFCKPIEGQNKNTETIFYQFIHKNDLCQGEKLNHVDTRKCSFSDVLCRTKLSILLRSWKSISRHSWSNWF